MPNWTDDEGHSDLPRLRLRRMSLKKLDRALLEAARWRKRYDDEREPDVGPSMPLTHQQALVDVLFGARLTLPPARRARLLRALNRHEADPRQTTTGADRTPRR